MIQTAAARIRVKSVMFDRPRPTCSHSIISVHRAFFLFPAAFSPTNVDGSARDACIEEVNGEH